MLGRMGHCHPCSAIGHSDREAVQAISAAPHRVKGVALGKVTPDKAETQGLAGRCVASH